MRRASRLLSLSFYSCEPWLVFVERGDDELEINFVLGEMFRQIGMRNDADDKTGFHVHGDERANALHVIADLEASHFVCDSTHRQLRGA